MKFHKVIKENIFVFIIGAILFCCSKPEMNKFSDEQIVKIYEFKDKRDTQGLLGFFDSENSIHRAEAAMACGSIQDSLTLPTLYKLLKDNSERVRVAAAFSIGQIRNPSSIKNLKDQLDNEQSETVIYELLLSLGNCADSLGITTLVNYEPNSNSQKEGKVWGLYRAGLKQIISEKGTQQVMELLSDDNQGIQLATSNYFSRLQIKNIDQYEDKLITALNSANSEVVKSNLARALGKINSDKAQNTLIGLLRKDINHLVLVNALRALNVKYESKYIEVVKQLISVESDQVASTASQVLMNSESIQEYEIKILIEKTSNFRARANLLGKWCTLNKRTGSAAIKLEYQNASNIYYKGELLKVLSSDVTALEFIANKTFGEEGAYLKTSGMIAMQRMLDNTVVDISKIATYFREAILSKDIGLISVAATALSDTTNGLLDQFENISFLLDAKENLELPIDAEALIAIESVIDAYEGHSLATDFTNPYNNPIDWNHLKTISKNQKVVLHTVKGDIVWRLMVEEAPGTVDFFLRLVKKGFYQGLTFHRVIPNFVAQGGCPRGDGYGGTPESIRSEFSLTRYKTGSVGMASAGKDTESCQFFITHSPTPHLNGSYTIFAEVIEGMEVAQNLDMGDKIVSIEIL